MSQRSIASVISSGTVPRSSPTIVVLVTAAWAAITASSSSRGIAHVHAVGRARPFGDPPQPLHAHHVVDAQHRCLLAGPRDEALPELVPAATPGRRQLRREPPVLSVGEELVRRRADRHGRCEERAVRPRLVAVGVAPDREVEEEHRPPRRPRPRRAGSGRDVGRARGCAEPARPAGRRRPARGGRPDSGRSRRRRVGRRRTAKRPPAGAGRGRRRDRAAGGAGDGRAPANRSDRTGPGPGRRGARRRRCRPRSSGAGSSARTGSGRTGRRGTRRRAATSRSRRHRAAARARRARPGGRTTAAGRRAPRARTPARTVRRHRRGQGARGIVGGGTTTVATSSRPPRRTFEAMAADGKVGRERHGAVDQAAARSSCRRRG